MPEKDTLQDLGLDEYKYGFVDEEKQAGGAEDEKGMVPFPQRLESLDSGQQATLAVLLVDGLVAASAEDFKRLKTHEKLV